MTEQGTKTREGRNVRLTMAYIAAAAAVVVALIELVPYFLSKSDHEGRGQRSEIRGQVSEGGGQRSEG